jgi:hypothetical protein
LPEATKPLAICLYNTLKTMPGIVAVDGFVQRDGEQNNAVIAYSYLGKDGKPETSTLDLSPQMPTFDVLNVGAAPGKDRPWFELDKTGSNDPFFGIAGQLAAKCQASFGYVDQVLGYASPAPPMQRVDMARYIK